MVSILALVIVFLLLILLSFVWPPDSPWSPQWRIKRKVARKALRFVKVGRKDTVYELGCGDGEFTLVAAEEFGARAIGIEIDPIRFIISLVRGKVSRSRENILILRKDFKKVDLSQATVVYMYLVPAALKRLLPQLKKQLKPSTRIISYRYEIPLSKNEKRIVFSRLEPEEKVYIYTITGNTGRD